MAEPINNNSVQKIQDILAPSALSVSPNYIQIGPKYARTIFLATYPRYLNTSWFSPIINLDRVFDISIFVHPKNTATVLKQLRDQLARLQAQAMEESSKGKVRDPILETAMQDIEVLRDKLQQGTDKFFELGVYITLYEDSVKGLDEAESKIKGLLEYQLIFAKAATFRMMDGFNSTLPMDDDRLAEHTSLNTEPISSLFPFVSFDLTSNSGVLYGINTHNNSLVLFDRFNLENANAVVFGKSGGGKSIKGTENVLVRYENKIQLLKIGALVDQLIKKRGIVKIDEELEGVLEPDIEVWAFDAKLKGSWSKVSVAARKDAPKDFYRFSTRSGRVVTTTGDHNMVILKDGVVITDKSTNIRPGQHVPLPRHIGVSANSEISLNLIEILEGSKNIYVAGAGEIIKQNYSTLKTRVIDYELDQYLYRYRDSRRVPLPYFKKIMKILDVNLNHPLLAGLKIVSKSGRGYAPVIFPISKSFLKIIGYIVAEGTITDDLIIISNTDPDIIKDIQIALSSTGTLFFTATDSINIGDRIFVEIIKQLGGKKKSNKKDVLPFIFGLKKDMIAPYLQSYFEGDGCIEHASVMAVSKSKELISGLCYLLYYFDIVGRIKRTTKKAPAWSSKKIYWKLIISGQNDLRKFASEIGFVSQRKNCLLSNITNRESNTNVDLVPELSGFFKEINEVCPSIFYGLSDISALKRGVYDPSPGKLNELTRMVRERIALYMGNASISYVSHGSMMTLISGQYTQDSFARKLEITEKLEKMLAKLEVFANSSLFWDEIVKIEKIKNKNDAYVYDLTVDNEVFLCGTGGLFVHNSYTTKLEMLRHLIFGTQVIVIDPEDEYKYLGDTVGGSTIKISVNSEQHLNPFDLPVPKEGEVSADIFKSHILGLTGLLKLMLGELTPEESAILDEALIQTYAIKDITPDSDFSQAAPPVLSDLLSILEGMTGAESMAIRLKKYTDGTFAGFLNKPTNVPLDNQLVVFSIRDMEEELRPIAMYLVLNHIWTAIRRELKKRILAIDEAWVLMKYPVGADFVSNIARRARKYYTGLTTISQDVSVFLASESGKSVLANSSIQVLMKQSPATIDVVQQTFNLTDAEKFYLLEARVGFGLFFLGQNHVGIRVVASYAEDQIITSDPRQILEIEKAKEEWAKTQ